MFGSPRILADTTKRQRIGRSMQRSWIKSQVELVPSVDAEARCKVDLVPLST